MKKLPGTGALLLLTPVLIGAALFVRMPSPPVSINILKPPGPIHWLGTTALGEDMLALLLAGSVATIAVGLAAGLLTTALGAMAGYLGRVCGRRVENVLLLGADIFLAIPETALLLLLATFLRPGPVELVAILVATGWAGELRIFAQAAHAELERESVEAAHLFGATRRHIFMRHVLPGIAPLGIARTVANTRRATLKHAGLAFLGFVDPLIPSWGGIMQNALPQLHTNAWLWLILPPVLCLSLYLLLVLFLGEKIIAWRWPHAYRTS